jgi:hypothetical protein
MRADISVIISLRDMRSFVVAQTTQYSSTPPRSRFVREDFVKKKFEKKQKHFRPNGQRRGLVVVVAHTHGPPTERMKN